MLVTLAGPTLAGEPTPAQRTNRINASNKPQATSTRTTAARELTRRTPVNDERLIGAGVRRTSTPTNDNNVRKASTETKSQVVKASSQMIDEGVVYEDGAYETSGGGYVNEGVSSGGSSCSSCGSGSCDGGSCGSSCGTSCGSRNTSGWGGCGVDLCNPGGGPGRQLCIALPSHGWAQFDYLMGWQSGLHVPTLVTSSPVGTAQTNAGVLNLNGTSTVFGNQNIFTDKMDGGRLRVGWWFANCPNNGVELEYLGFRSPQLNRVDQSTGATGSQILARPFFNIAPDTGMAREDSELVAFPNVVRGSFTTQAISTLDGAAVRFRHLLCCSSGCATSHITCGAVPTQSRIDATLGWRFFQLHEGLTMREDLTSLRTTDPGSFVIQDNFRTRNQFNGVEMGTLWQGRRGYWSLDALLRCSVGNIRQEVIIDGSTATTQNGTTTNANGGLYAQRTNSGVFTREVLGVIPEFGANLGYQLTQRWRLNAGYTFIYWSNVVRPGDQIDQDVNPNLLPPETVPFTGAARPRFTFNETDYWLQAVNLGAEYRW